MCLLFDVPRNTPSTCTYEMLNGGAERAIFLLIQKAPREVQKKTREPPKQNGSVKSHDTGKALFRYVFLQGGKRKEG